MDDRIVASAALEIRIRPETGARIVSIRDPRSGREWLVPSEPETPRPYGSSYTDGRLVFGWDEMVPTIDACVVDGTEFPDHGELWAVPWREVPATADSGVRFAGSCRRAPLELEREAWADGEAIVLDYLLRNTSDGEVRAYWAAHPFFAAGAEATVGFAPQVERAEIALPVERRGGATWLEIEALAAALPEGSFLKVVAPSDAVTSATIHDGADALEISWSGPAVRHLAVVWDNHTFASSRALAIEPMTARGDTPLADGCLVLPPRGEKRWTLRLRPVGEPPGQ